MHSPPPLITNTALLAYYGRTAKWRRAYVGGTFDLLHRGHLGLLRRVREIADTTVVALNTSEFAERYKRPPVMPLGDRMAVLAELRDLVDDVIVNIGDEDSRPAILAAAPDCIVHGDDWQGASLMQQMGLTDLWLADQRIDLVVVPYTPIISTSRIVELYLARIGAR